MFLNFFNSYCVFFFFTSSSSLFTVSSGHAFVHVQPSTTEFDPVDILLNKLARPSISTNWSKHRPIRNMVAAN